MSPTPYTLFCVLVLTLPLALVYTVITTSTGPDTAIFTIATHQKPINFATSILPPAFPLPSPTTPPPLSNARDNEDEDDKILCRLASQVNPEPSSPRKLAFLFLTTTPLPLAPLWELFFEQANEKLYNIYIHADPNFNYDDPPFTGVFFNRTIPSKATQRHSPTLGSAHRRLLARALLDDPANYMFALISPSCIPLHSFRFTYKYLIGSRKSFVQILDDHPLRYPRWAARGDHVMLPEVPFDSFRVGSQFSVLTRKHARTFVSDTLFWSKYNKPCLPTRMIDCYREENYFPTFITMVDPGGFVPATVTHVDWTEQHDEGHPHTYHAPEVELGLIRKLRRDKPEYGSDGTNGSDSLVRRQQQLRGGFLDQGTNAIEAVQNPNDLKIDEGLDDLSVQAELNIADSYILLQNPVPEFQMWLPGNVDTPFFGQNDLHYNSINCTDYGSNGTSILPANGFSGPSVNNSMLRPASMANQEEGFHWFDDLFATTPQENNDFGGSTNAENANGASLEGFLQSFWDCVPARSASATEQPCQTKISHASMAKKTRKSTGNMLLSKHYKFPSIAWKHKNFKKTTTSSRGTKFGFVYGLALAMWFSLLMVTAKLGCFVWKLILS